MPWAWMLSASSYSAPSSMRVRGWYWPATMLGHRQGAGHIGAAAAAGCLRCTLGPSKASRPRPRPLGFSVAMCVILHQVLQQAHGPASQSPSPLAVLIWPAAPASTQLPPHAWATAARATKRQYGSFWLPTSTPETAALAAARATSPAGAGASRPARYRRAPPAGPPAPCVLAKRRMRGPPGRQHAAQTVCHQHHRRWSVQHRFLQWNVQSPRSGRCQSCCCSRW